MSLTELELGLLARSLAASELTRLLQLDVPVDQRRPDYPGFALSREELSVNEALPWEVVQRDVQERLPLVGQWLIQPLVTGFGFLVFRKLYNEITPDLLDRFEIPWQLDPYLRESSSRTILKIRKLLRSMEEGVVLDRCWRTFHNSVTSVPDGAQLSEQLAFADILQDPSRPWSGPHLLRNPTFPSELLLRPPTHWGFTGKKWDWKVASQKLPSEFILAHPELPWEPAHFLLRRPEKFTRDLLGLYLRSVQRDPSQPLEWNTEVQRQLQWDGSRLGPLLAETFSSAELASWGIDLRQCGCRMDTTTMRNPNFMQALVIKPVTPDTDVEFDGLPCWHSPIDKLTGTVAELYRYWDTVFQPRWDREVPRVIRGLQLEDLRRLNHPPSGVPGCPLNERNLVWADIDVRVGY